MSGDTKQVMLKKIVDAMVKGDSAQTIKNVEEALTAGISPDVVIKDSLLPGMELVSEKYQRCELYVGDLIASAGAMQEGAKIIKEKLRKENVVCAQGWVVIGTIEGDIHDLGKNIVVLTLEGSGYEVIDLGVNVKPAQFVDAVNKYRPEIVCISSLLTITMLNMKEVIKALERADLRQHVKIVVGGAPVTYDFATSIGADAYVEYGTDIVRKIIELTCKGSKDKLSVNLLSILHKQDYQSIFQELTGIKPVIIDEKDNVLLKGDNCPDTCRVCLEWSLKEQTDSISVYICPGNLVRVEAEIAADITKGKLICGPLLTDTEDERHCRPSLQHVSPHKLTRITIAARMMAELLSAQLQEKNLKYHLEGLRKNVLRSMKYQDELKTSLKEANYCTLQSQVNPHFLFNSINSVARLAMLEEAKQTEQFAYALSRTLRYTLKNIKSQVKIIEELQMIRDYLFVQQVRFSDRISVDVEIEDEIQDVRIPCMVLQPLVENAIIHGLEPLEEGGSFQLYGKHVGQTIVFSIIDNGIGIPHDKLKKIALLDFSSSGDGHTTGLGLSNVYQRLLHNYGSGFGLEIQSEEGSGTTVQVMIPYTT
ncbi:MAG: cobalamin-dependent protein [Desulfitobacteriaceae bacterium]|nr:cobalamin-dependent protein [Desulfitobacteriaceae bacterium]